jgi:hypothetical protein
LPLQGGEIAIDFLHVDRKGRKIPIKKIDRAIEFLDPRNIDVAHAVEVDLSNRFLGLAETAKNRP